MKYHCPNPSHTTSVIKCSYQIFLANGKLVKNKVKQKKNGKELHFKIELKKESYSEVMANS